ncbi:hypothetical protein [Bailinhaonella thermotolerans]|nr:hypothetical protein [Bailinhaonella thermotolerans]
MDAALGAGGQLSALYATVVELERFRTLAREGSPGEEEATERRRLLGLAAGAGAGALGVPAEQARRLLELSFGAEGPSVEEWELTCADHLHGLRTRAPAGVAADLLADLRVLRGQLDTARSGEVGELWRVAAMLSAVHANALTRLGDHGAAIRWWRTARRAADACGEPGIRLLVRDEEAGHGLYGQREPATVLRLVEDAGRIAGRPSVGLVTTRLKALAMLGRHDEARAGLAALHDAADRGADGDPVGFWKPDQVHFAESWVHAARGDEDAAGAARDRVLSLARDYQYRANVTLHAAWCAVAAGGVSEGVRQATELVASLAPAYRSHHILESARVVLHAVPPGRRSLPQVRDLRRVLAAPL